MNKLFIISVICFAQVTYAATRPERFFRAEEGKVLTQAGAVFFNYTTTLSKEGENLLGKSEIEGSSTTYDVQGEYGLTKDLSLGISLSQAYGDGYEGLGDYEFFAKGQFQNFFYGLNYYYSHEEMTVDNNTSGGSYYDFYLGYYLDQGLGFKVYYQPEYDYSFKDDNTDYVNGANLMIEAFYELTYGGNLYGVSIGNNDSRSNTEDGVANGVDNMLLTFEGYSVIELKDGLSFVPAINYSHEYGKKNDLVDSFNLMGLNLSFRYEM
jgi:hypothetical protein